MQAFAALLERLVLTPQRNVKLRLLTDYFRATPDPDRGYALAALTGDLDVRSVKPAMLRALAAERVDEVLFAYSYDYVGDLAETISLTWPARGGRDLDPPLEGEGRTEGPGWGDEKNEESPPTGRASPGHPPPPPGGGGGPPPGGGGAPTKRTKNPPPPAGLRPSTAPLQGEAKRRPDPRSRPDSARSSSGCRRHRGATGRGWSRAGSMRSTPPAAGR